MKKLLGILVLCLLWCNVGFAKEVKYICKMYYTNPPLSDVELSKFPLVPIYIDKDKKKIRYIERDFKGEEIYLEFNNSLVSWRIEEKHPATGELMITFMYFDLNTKEMVSNLFPSKKNLVPEDLRMQTKFKCK